jgi:hypothetical protein
MARKTSKKTAKSKPRKAARKTTGRRPAARPAKKAARKASTGPKPIKTGRGPTPREIGDTVVAHFNKGGPDKVLWEKYWHPGVESVEGEGMSMLWKGRKAIAAKGAWWMENNTVHSASAEGPYVGATGFTVRFRMDVEEKASGKRRQIEEVGVYTVQNGKVIREEFMYGPTRIISEGRPADAGGGGASHQEAEELESAEPVGV